VVKDFELKIEGTQEISAPRDRVFSALVDPEVLQKCIPGCDQMEKTGENQYNAKLSAGVGAIKGVFTATVTLEDISPPEHFKLVVEGKGQSGFVKGSGELTLSEDGEETSVKFTADVNVGGLLASVGQRMIQGAAGMMAGKFFKLLEKEAKEYSTAS
jgi:carbon monoxide dehydrogenase subunit G